jgi:hypothetical protein
MDLPQEPPPNQGEDMEDDADLLAEIATLDEVSAWIPTGADHDYGITPQWCELVLEIKREADDDEDGPGAWPFNTRLALRRHDGELISSVLGEVLHPTRNRMAIEAIWDELDEVVERIQRRVAKGKEPMRRDVGHALGLATALAIIDRPHDPDVDEVRAVAVERYELRHGISGGAD